MCTVKNITVTLPENLERWLQIRAAEDGLTVSGWVRRLIERTRDREHHFKSTVASYFSTRRGRTDWPDGNDPKKPNSR